MTMFEAEDGWCLFLWVINRSQATFGRPGQCTYIDAVQRVQTRVGDVIRVGKHTG